MGTRSNPTTNPSIAGLTQPEGLDSPIYDDFSSSTEGRQRPPSDCCFTHHNSPRYPGFICTGPTVSYWPTSDCRLCNTDIISSLPNHSMQAQSGINSNTIHETTTGHEQIITHFADNTPTQEVGYDGVTDDSLYEVDTDEVSLQKFLSRPVKLFSQILTPNTTLLTTPVQVGPGAIFTNKRVSNRLNNYRNMKCSICFRVLVNGSPFHYGRYMYAVVPNANVEGYITGTTPAGTDNVLARVQLSQVPHVLIDPSTNEGGCIKVPYVHYYNAYDTSIGEFFGSCMGYLVEMSPLRQLIAAPTNPVTITIVGWLEDVVLGAPTGAAFTGLSAQSGTKDEYGTGVISRPALVLSRAAAILSHLAPIKSYALVSKAVFDKTYAVAIALGFCKPNVVSDFSFMANRALPNLCSSTQHDPIFKMTFDDKQEVTIDPKIVGLAPKDEMQISDIVTRMSYVNKFTWGSSAAAETAIWWANALPLMYAQGTAAAATPTAFPLAVTPMTYTAQAFRYWRGSIRFRFVAVCSSFHRGRVRICFDPQGNLSTTAIPEYNTVYNYIWDLADNHEAIIDCCYMNHKPYLKTPQLISTGTNYIKTTDVYSTTYGAPTGIAFDSTVSNGVISLTVMNPLAANGVSSPDIEVLMYVSAGPDFELFDPTDYMDQLTFAPQSGIAGEVDSSVINPVVPYQPTAVFGKYFDANSSGPVIHYGDPVTSLRYLLKRYVKYDNILIYNIQPLATQLSSYRRSAYPLNKGKVPNAMHFATGSVVYNYVHTTHIAWFSAMFFARRGGLRVRVRDVSSRDITAHVRATRIDNPGFAVGTISNLVQAGTSTNQRLMLETPLTRSGLPGSVVSSTQVNKGTLDFEVPYYSPLRYFSTRTPDNSTRHNQGYVIDFILNNSASTNKDAHFEVYTSAADDYSLVGFVGCPTVYSTISTLA